MDCVICGSTPHFLRRRWNIICGTCFEGAKNLLDTLLTLEKRQKESDDISYCFLGGSDFNPNSNKTLMNIWRCASRLIDVTEELIEQITFLVIGPLLALKDQIQHHIFVRPANNGPSIPAHKVILATGSEIFKGMLDLDICKAPINDMVMLSKLSYEELESLLEFLYTGMLDEETMEKHLYTLSLTDDKYNIPYLQKTCERHMLKSLSLSNTLKIFEVSNVCSYQNLKKKS